MTPAIARAPSTATSPGGRYTFSAGATVEARTRVRNHELAYEYAFWRTPDVEISGSLGVALHEAHAADVGSRDVHRCEWRDLGGVVHQQAELGSRAAPGRSARAPLGVRAAVGPRGPGTDLQADISGYDGRVTDLRGGVTWMFSQNFGAGVGYNRFTTRSRDQQERFNGQVRLNYSGVQLH
jgi:hypothetical protein